MLRGHSYKRDKRATHRYHKWHIQKTYIVYALDMPPLNLSHDWMRLSSQIVLATDVECGTIKVQGSDEQRQYISSIPGDRG